MWFIAALFTLGAAYIYGKAGRASDEIAITCIPVSFCGLLFTLISAPWQIQVLLLVGALVSYPFTKTKILN